MGYKRLFLYGACILLFGFQFCSCSDDSSKADCPVLKVDLRESTPSIKELFSRIEVVPLEDHNDSCLVMRLSKVLSYKDKIYVVDRKIPACYEFDRNGNFIRQIGHAGNGPGEYIYANVNSVMTIYG